MSIHTLSIIIPTYNEAENIDPLLRRIFAVDELSRLDPEIVFSDGASTDATCHKVEKWMARSNRIRLLRSEANEGLSAAVIAGARAAEGDIVVVIDADLSHPVEVIPQLVAPIAEGLADMCIGSRYVQGGATPEWPMSRKISSILATLPARLFTDVKDPLAGFIAVRRERLADMTRKVCGFKIGLELLATSREGLRVKEIPIIFRDRCFGTSKMSPQVVYDYFRQLLILAGVDLVPFPPLRILTFLFFLLVLDGGLFLLLQWQGSSLFTAHVCSYGIAMAVAVGTLASAIFAHGKSLSIRRKLEYVFGGGWVAFLVFLLRGGLVATLATEGRLGVISIICVALFSIITGYGGYVAYVLSIGRKRIRPQLVMRFYGLGVFLYLLLLRLVYLGAVPVLPEEQALLQTLDGWPLMGASAQGVGSIVWLRLGSWLLFLCSTVCMFSLARVMFDRSTAFMTGLLFGVLPVYFGSGLFASRDALLIFCWSCSLHILFRILVSEVARGWLWAGLLVGVGMQIDIRMAAILAVCTMYLIVHGRSRQRPLSMAGIAFGVLALTTIPAILFGAFGTTAKDNVEPWLVSLLGGSLAESVFAVLLLLSPTGLLAGCHALYGWLMAWQGRFAGNPGLETKRRHFVLLTFFVPFLLFILPGMYTGGAMLAGSVCWLVLLPSMAGTVMRGEEHAGPVRRCLAGIWWPTIGLLMAGYGLVLHMVVL